MMSRPSVLKLEPRIQHYAWGDRSFIPDLLRRRRDDRPWAEAWYGAHPAAPAFVKDMLDAAPLDALIASSPEMLLGNTVAREYGSLPYLVKILAAAQPLSIQVHPNPSQAQAGFEREQSAGVPIDAPQRNYRDRNAKPELIVALTPFHALCGFRSIPDMAATLESAPEICALMPELPADRSALDAWLASWFALPEDSVRKALSQLLRRLEMASPAPATPAFWALRAQQALGEDAPPDRGLLFLFMLELRHLEPGQALYLDAGVPHAYLQGAGIEVMAASDNVLRAGLTPKHVDVQELLRIIDSGQPAPAVITADETGSYQTPAEEFALQQLQPGSAPNHRAASPELLLSLHGRMVIEVPGGGSRVVLRPGEAALAAAGSEYRAEAGPGSWRVTVPTLA